MSRQAQAEGGILMALGIFLLVTAAEAWGLNWVWNSVVTVRFGADEMLFGHMFMMVLAIRVFFRDILKLGDILEVLEEIKEIQYFEVQNDARKASKEREKSGTVDRSDK